MSPQYPARFTALVELEVDECRELVTLDGLHNVPALEDLDFDGCASLTDVRAIRALPALNKLRVRGCTALASASAAIAPFVGFWQPIQGDSLQTLIASLPA